MNFFLFKKNRDLKPENILLDSDHPDANLMIIDFGACR